MPFGSLAFLGAAASLVFCYGQVLISLLAPLFGMAAFELNIHLQAVFMWGFALVTVMGLFNDQKLHKSKVPLVVSAVAVVTIIFTLYVYYDIRILILGYVLLVIAALLNQNMRLVSLNREVKAQADRLSDLNQTLEKRVEDQVEEIERIAQLKRFLSSEVADLITAEGKESLLDSHRRQIACLFCDLRNFTAFSESVEPEDVMDVLQAVHTTMGDLAARHGGSIGHLSGDGLMVIFNDPLPCDEPVARAIRLALDMRRAFTDIQARWRDLGHELGLGIGIAYGYATLGLIGSEGRHDYTAIGNVVNIAARLCDQADDGDILIDKRAHVEVETATQTEAAGLLSLKGVGKKVEAYKVMGAAETA
ncbi:MAG: adenylate/guanylate cyclase domain-containing protein [Pseudomonadota bacterium]